MRKIKLGIFPKAFLYTAVLLVLILGATITMFVRQFSSVYEAGQKQQLLDALQPLLNPIEGKSNGEIVALAKEFHEKNLAIQFVIQDTGGRIIFSTASETQAEFVNKEIAPNGDSSDTVFYNKSAHVYSLGSEATIYGYFSDANSAFFAEILNNSALLLILILLVSIAGAYLCARALSKPIQRLAASAAKMSKLEPVFPPRPRADEIGQLSETVFEMYEELKETISRLEDEVAVKEEMEQRQKDFFSAASHELKTPVAAMAALIEEMLEGVAGQEEYPRHLRKCMKMIAAQKRLISEILEVVRLNDGKVENCPEKLPLLEITGQVAEKPLALAALKELDIEIDMPETACCLVDRKLFDLALSNIIMNAVQNTRDGERVKIWSETGGDGQIGLCVLNTGAHIEKNQIAQLFNPFYRLDKARSRKDGHSGLGLAIVKKLLDGAKIPFSLENTPDGVLFQMKLPAA
jgi:two-component system sensor histidine kinase VanS